MKKILLIDDSDTYIWNLRKYWHGLSGRGADHR